MSERNSTDRLFLSVSVSGFDGDIDTLLERIDEQLTSRFETTLETELSPGNVDIESFRAPLYSQVGDDCPDCLAKLELIQPELDCDNGAFVSANCRECGWSGCGEYRLIDLLEYPDEGETDSRSIWDPVSLVATGSIGPSYYPYPDPSTYDR